MKITNNFNITKPLYEAITKDEGEITESESLLRVTSLINPPKITILKIRYDNEIIIDASDMLWSVLGKMGHKVCESINPDNRLIEERLSEEVAGVTITGKPDLMEGIIDDYKFTSVYSYLFNKSGKKEWIEQLNSYAWLFRRKGFNDLVKKLRVNLILRDWIISKAKFDKTYPQIPFVSIRLPLLSFIHQELYMQQRVDMYKRCFQLSDDEVPICSEADRWRKPDKYALMKEGRKTAIKVFEDKNMAENELKKIEKDGKFFIEVRPSEDVRCKSYCLVMPFCDYGKQYI